MHNCEPFGSPRALTQAVPIEPVVAVDHWDLLVVHVAEVFLVDGDVGQGAILLAVDGLHPADVGDLTQSARVGIPLTHPRLGSLLARVVDVGQLAFQFDLGPLEQNLNGLIKRMAFGRGVDVVLQVGEPASVGRILDNLHRLGVPAGVHTRMPLRSSHSGMVLNHSR